MDEYSPEQRVVQKEGRGNYIYTYTGKRFFIDDPQPEDICIEDIAHALSYQCRFNGHVHRFYSVAQHSILVSRLVSQENALWGLLHDSSETYLPDVPRPFKGALSNFRDLEERLLRVITGKWGLPWPMPEEVHYIDSNIVATEAKELWPGLPPWTEHFDHIECPVDRWSIKETEVAFVNRFNSLVKK